MTVMTRLFDGDTGGRARFKEFRELPARPADNRCELCGEIYKPELHWDLDQELRDLYPLLSLEACFRGWLCRGCHNLLKWVYLIGRKKVRAYLDRCIPLGDNPPERPADGRCELCEKRCGEKLHHDHCHTLEASGYPLFGSQRGYLCQSCNTDKLARIDKIGESKFRQYLDRARNNLS